MNWLNDWPKKYFGHIPFKSITKQKTYFSHILWLPYWSFIIWRWWDSKEALFRRLRNFMVLQSFPLTSWHFFENCADVCIMYTIGVQKCGRKRLKKPLFYRRVVPLFFLDHFTISRNAGNFLWATKNYYYNCYLCMLLTQLFLVSRVNCKPEK